MRDKTAVARRVAALEEPGIRLASAMSGVHLTLPVAPELAGLELLLVAQLAVALGLALRQPMLYLPERLAEQSKVFSRRLPEQQTVAAAQHLRTAFQGFCFP